jgi:hypothetical protein
MASAAEILNCSAFDETVLSAVNFGGVRRTTTTPVGTEEHASLTLSAKGSGLNGFADPKVVALTVAQATSTERVE